MLYNYQKKAIAQVHKLFETVKKICLAVSCSGGKTIMAIGIANDFIISNSKIKILILTHGQVLLRQQFNAECQQYEERVGSLSPNFKNAAVEKSSEFNKLYQTHSVLITIPQTIKNLKSLPKFDLVIVDEAHQFYSANMVSKIIKSCKADKELVLTGTPSYFIRHKWPIVPVSMGSLYPEFIQDFIIELAYSSSYVMGDNDYDYNRGEISKKSEKKVLTKKGTRETLDGLLDFIHKRAKMIWKKFPSIANALIKFPDWIVASKKLEKTMIACQSQVQAKYVQEYFEEKGIKTLLSISEIEGASDSIKTFNEFKVNEEIKILIVVGRGILGFNFPDLVNVFDLTCSTNVERIFQLMSRVTRKSNKKCQKLFLKVAPDLNIGLKGKDYFNYIMSAVLSLTDDYWFTNFDGKNMLKLRIPRLPSLSGKRSSISGTPKKSKFINLQNFIGLPALKFFRDLKKKFNEDHYSYAYTTLGIVRHELGISKDLETASNEMTIKVCEWIKKEKRTPTQNGDAIEKSYTNFISSRRTAKRGSKDNIWYDSDQEILNSYNLPDLFDKQDLEGESNKRTIDICDKIIGKKKLSKKDRSFICTKRRAKRGCEGSVWYESDKKILDSKGLPYLFESNDLEILSNKKVTEICEYLIKEDIKSPRKSDQKFYNFVQSRRSAKKGDKEKIWYDSDQTIADSYGFGALFENKDLEKKSNSMTTDVCLWIKENDRNPSSNSNDATEKLYANFIGSKRKDKAIVYESDIKILKSFDMPTLFKIKDREKESNNSTHELCSWINKHNKLPSTSMRAPKQERVLAAFLNKRRKAKKENKSWYDSDQEIASSYKLCNIFDVNHMEWRSNRTTNNLCEWVIKNKRIPSTISKDKEERYLANFLSCRKQGKKGKTYANWYDSDQKIAEDHGLSSLFSDSE